MNVYECNGTNIFMRWKMKCSIQRGEAELNGTFNLSPNAFAPRKVSHDVFLISLVLEQTSKILYWKYWTLYYKSERWVQ